MKKNSRANKGQFSIIAALLVAIILVAAVIMTYAAVRNNPFQQSPKVLSSIGEMNLSIKRILEFATGYYGSILQVTGNSTYANELTSSYLHSGFINIARSHPGWNPSFNINSSSFSTLWFAPTSHSMGSVSVTYSLSGLGIEGIKYETSSLLKVEILESLDGQARLNITREGNKPYLTLGTENFFFYSYSYSDLAWKLVPPASEPQALSDGTYILQIPDGVDPAAYSIQVVDPRSIMVIAFFSEGSLVSGVPQYTYKLTWNSSLYSSLTGGTIVVEALQDGTLRWLGQELELSPGERPIPPIPVKSFRVNQTIDGVSREVPFQVEDWGSNYRVPLGLSSKYSVFSSRNMIVFLVNHEVQEVTLWWDGSDRAEQRSYDSPFKDDDPATGILTNGILTLNLGSRAQSLYVNSYDGTYTDWTETGSAPYLNNDLSNYISSSGSIQQDNFGYETRGGSSASIKNGIRGYRSTCTYGGNAKSITVWLRVTTASKRVRCAIYDTSYNLIAQTEERTIPAGTNNWQTFNFAAPYPQLSAGTDYWLVAWGQSASGVLEIYYDSGPSGVGLYTGRTYSSAGFPSSLTSPTIQSRRYSIYCTYEYVGGDEGWFGFQDGTGSGTIESVKIQFECQSEGDDYFDLRVNDGTTTYGWYSITELPTSYDWREYDLSSILDTWTKIRNAEIYVRYRKQGEDSSTVYIRRCRLLVEIDTSGTFKVTSTVGTSSAEAQFLRINDEPSYYGAAPAYVIHHGIVRDIVQQEAEWSGGAPDCPNVYSQIVLTLPANATYYTYALRTIFVNSLQSRTITDLSAIQLLVGRGQALTENGTIGGMPIVSNATGLFYNFSGSETGWAHHWSEFIESDGGSGIMFTDSSNLKLYVFDSIPPSQERGALNVITDSQTIEFNPVAEGLGNVSLFTDPLDVTWHGAVVTFDSGKDPIYPNTGEDPPLGLWIIVEHPPTIEVS